MSEILVLDGHHRSALTILRSLGQRDDITVTVAATESYHPGLLSRYTDKRYLHEPLSEDPVRFVEDLKQHIDMMGYDAVIPVSDPTSVVCSKHKSKLDETGASIGVEDWEIFERTYDKALTAELADKADVPMPETQVPEADTELDNITNLSFPQVVKPRSKSLWTDDGEMSLNLVTDDNYVQNPTELEEMFKSLSGRISDPNQFPLLQEYINGEIQDTSLLADDGEIVAYVQNKRVRTQPRSGGGYTLVESLHSEQMLLYAQRLVKELQWTGPINFEFMYDGETYYLLESNGRYWGSLGLALNCGIDIPYFHYQQLTEGDTHNKNVIHRNGAYADGIQQRWLFPGDFLWLFETIELGEWADIPAFISSFRDASHDLPSLNDPLPLAGKLVHIGKTAYDALSDGNQLYTR